MKIKYNFLFLVAIIALSSGCTTRFHKDSHTDRAGCEKKCKEFQMDLDGMVTVGEVSEGCICRKHANSTESKTETLIEKAPVSSETTTNPSSLATPAPSVTPTPASSPTAL